MAGRRKKSKLQSPVPEKTFAEKLGLPPNSVWRNSWASDLATMGASLGTKWHRQRICVKATRTSSGRCKPLQSRTRCADV